MTIINDFPALTLSNNICQEVTPDQLETYIQSSYSYGIVIGLMQILYNDETIILLHISGNMYAYADSYAGNVSTSLGFIGWDIGNDGAFAVPNIKIVLENGDVVIEVLLSNLQCAEGWSVKCYYFGVVPFEQ